MSSIKFNVKLTLIRGLNKTRPKDESQAFVDCGFEKKKAQH